MTLIFPRAMPIGVAAQTFELDRVDLSTERAGGRVNGVSVGLPRWSGRWTLSQQISQAASDEWRAFVTSLRGLQRPFFGFDQGRPFPKATPNGFAGLSRAGGGAFDGAATSWSVNTERDVLGLAGLPAGLILSLGDYAMLRWTTGGGERRSLHRVVEGAVANGSGAASPSVEPPVPAFVPGSAVADLARPCCVMKLTSETKLGDMGRSLRISGTIVAVQDLRA